MTPRMIYRPPSTSFLCHRQTIRSFLRSAIHAEVKTFPLPWIRINLRSKVDAAKVKKDTFLGERRAREAARKMKHETLSRDDFPSFPSTTNLLPIEKSFNAHFWDFFVDHSSEDKIESFDDYYPSRGTTMIKPFNVLLIRLIVFLNYYIGLTKLMRF